MLACYEELARGFEPIRNGAFFFQISTALSVLQERSVHIRTHTHTYN